MKLTIIAIGSRGDVQPCVALGRALLDAGYEVRVVTLQNFRSFVEEQGLAFFPVEGDAQALVNEMMLSQDGGLNLFGMFRAMMRSFGAITEDYHRAFSDPVLRDADAILSQLPAGFYGYDLAESLNVPYIALSVIPQETTSAYPLSLIPSRVSLGKGYNRLTYDVMKQVIWQAFRKPINRFRKQLGLQPASFWWGNMRRMVREQVPVLQGFSEEVVPAQPEWGAYVHITGYWMLEEADWQPSEALANFLDAGTAPVFIGFGSMPVRDPQVTTALILEALAHSNRRGILLRGWADLKGTDLPDTVFLLDYAPYAWLFPRMAAIVHHGGSGTTGLALRSGVPSMVVPFLADQPFWGKRTHELGVGVNPIPFSKLTADNLADAIHILCEDKTMQERATQLRDAMAHENGLARAVEIIRRYLDG